MVWPEVGRRLRDIVAETESNGDAFLVIEASVLHTPGHTPGSLCLSIDADDRPVVLAGDTLFRQSIGRTDLWGGDSQQILDSIRKKLFSLPDETLVITGHGPTTTIGEERRLNPFLQS